MQDDPNASRKKVTEDALVTEYARIMEQRHREERRQAASQVEQQHQEDRGPISRLGCKQALSLERGCSWANNRKVFVEELVGDHLDFNVRHVIYRSLSAHVRISNL